MEAERNPTLARLETALKSKVEFQINRCIAEDGQIYGHLQMTCFGLSSVANVYPGDIPKLLQLRRDLDALLDLMQPGLISPAPEEDQADAMVTLGWAASQDVPKGSFRDWRIGFTNLPEKF